jgi:exopolysaccharide/PEP-CTERM locus tyrosine autokinase
MRPSVEESIRRPAKATVSQEVTHTAEQFQPEPAQPAARATMIRPADNHDSPTRRDLKPMIQLDVAELRASGRLPTAEMAQQTEDEIRRIKWPLLNAIAGREGSISARNNIILVTSALSGEGKSFTSLNLALSIVRDRELRVILVDGDVARPGLTPSLKLEGRPGLNDVLEDVSLDVNNVTYQTDVEGLFFVPAGKWHERAPEFFAGSRMPQIIEQLSRRVGNGVIIIDSPPLLATNEAQVVTRYVGQILLVVRADETEQRAVLDALALVDKSTPISAVLNQVRPSALSRYYGQYYYRYGYGGRGKVDEGAQR